ncbi:MAG: malic enzyme-like NAD(P)-binding protein, partial [Candidatus Phytoplasma australasiaticum]|nr:malic enzyme-like NAD(P)-binding protein [Candidatus Phytoplasma australasiaticum]
VAEPCRKIHEKKENIYKYTMKSNTVGVITNGTAVLGLGNIGPEASLPVMEGKSVLIERFAGLNSFPICVSSYDIDEFVCIVEKISTVFGAINLEDIKAPECFEIEKKLQEKLDIPVFHDDQHGTSIVISASLINALKVVNKTKEDAKIVICGAGSAGISTTKMLLSLGFKNIVLYDKHGAICKEDTTNLNEYQ